MQPLAKERKSSILLVTGDRRILHLGNPIVSIEDRRLVREKVATPTVISN